MVLSCMFVGLFCIGYDIRTRNDHLHYFLYFCCRWHIMFCHKWWSGTRVLWSPSPQAPAPSLRRKWLFIRLQRYHYVNGVWQLCDVVFGLMLHQVDCTFCDVCCTYLWQNFLDYFMRGLSYEYRNSGVTFQCLMPFYVATRMTSYSSTLSKASVLIPSARTYVQHALSTLGWTSRTTGYWPHTVQVSLRLSRVHCCMYVHAGVLALSTQHGSMAVDFLAFFMRIELKAVVFHCHD